MTSPPHSLTGSSTCETKSFNPVSVHSLLAKLASSIWKRSLTRTASPFLGIPGVVERGKDFKKATYLAQRVEVQRFEMVRIWEGRTVSKVSESAGRSGCKGGQFGGACCWTGVVVLGSSLGCLDDFGFAILLRRTRYFQIQSV